WRLSTEDLRMVEAVRKYMGDKAIITCDGNSTYTETEARTIFTRLSDYNVSLLEDPCDFPDAERQAALAAVLPMALLGDHTSDSLHKAAAQIRARAVG